MNERKGFVVAYTNASLVSLYKQLQLTRLLMLSPARPQSISCTSCDFWVFVTCAQIADSCRAEVFTQPLFPRFLLYIASTAQHV